MLDLMTFGFALFGCFELIRRICFPNVTYTKIYNVISDSLNKEPERFSIQENMIFKDGMLETYEKYSVIPFKFAGQFEGSCYDFLVYQLEYVGKSPALDTFRIVFNNLITKVFGFSGIKNYNFKIFDNATASDTYIFYVYYGVNKKQVIALEQWYQQQVNQAKQTYTSLLVTLKDPDLETELESYGC